MIYRDASHLKSESSSSRIKRVFHNHVDVRTAIWLYTFFRTSLGIVLLCSKKKFRLDYESNLFPAQLGDSGSATTAPEQLVLHQLWSSGPSRPPCTYPPAYAKWWKNNFCHGMANCDKLEAWATVYCFTVGAFSTKFVWFSNFHHILSKALFSALWHFFGAVDHSREKVWSFYLFCILGFGIKMWQCICCAVCYPTYVCPCCIVGYDLFH